MRFNVRLYVCPCCTLHISFFLSIRFYVNIKRYVIVIICARDEKRLVHCIIYGACDVKKKKSQATAALCVLRYISSKLKIVCNTPSAAAASPSSSSSSSPIATSSTCKTYLYPRRTFKKANILLIS